jgi:putative drug exporter of the RND superfamily
VHQVRSAAGVYAQGQRLADGPPRLSADGAVLLQVVTLADPSGPAARDLVHRVRALPAPDGRAVLVGGASARLVDITASLGRRAPLEIGLAALLSLLLLLLATRSLLLPVKALVFNVFGLVAILGAMVWVFQDGHLSGLLGFTPSPITVTIPPLLLCIAYGLSMDYEVFVLSRIRESYLAGADPRLAVRRGLGGSGPVISAAAAVLAVSFFSTAISGVSMAKLFGLGTGLAIILDALLIRGVLVPAFLRLVGRAAWWAPGPLRSRPRLPAPGSPDRPAVTRL